MISFQLQTITAPWLTRFGSSFRYSKKNSLILQDFHSF